MSGADAALAAHLATGATTVARCWALERRDGVRMGFTDHDMDLAFDGLVFRAASGLGASALAQSSGLAVGNAEVLGALRGGGLTEADIRAGRYDDAQVSVWLVNWKDVTARRCLFAGSLGEIERSGADFKAELRGLAEALNQPRGRVYQARCAALLGDGACGVDLSAAGYREVLGAEAVEDGWRFRFAGLGQHEPGWFERGMLRVESGAAAGRDGLIKSDFFEGATRVVELWEAIPVPVAPGDLLMLEAGCDKAAATCRLKFDNFLNFRGFPHIPGDDWLMRVPTRAGENTGGSLFGDAQ